MKPKTIIALAALAALSACQDEAASPTKAAVADTPPDPVQQKIDTIEEAMSQVPPADRYAFHYALICEINQRGSDNAINIDAEYIRDLTARLKADPSIATC